MSELIKRARQIAEAAHAGQTDKAGAPYVTHPLRVADAVEGEEAKIVAILHDVVEDSEAWTLQRLREEGYSEAVVAAVDALTDRAGEEYFDLVRRARENPLARTVKSADLADNIERTRLSGMTPEKEARIARYEAALAILDGTG
ncbi:HD domain-containing protein [Jiella sp. M17.18]|uniref:HD domain-containing protein n=1 Tax=Jiella sp. M17.18 TaxID=3234247 RepID=UPI0034DF225D